MPKPNPLNPITTDPDFHGWPGAVSISLGLPALFIVFAYACNEHGCPASYTSLEPYLAMLDPSSSTYLSPFSWIATGAYLAWFTTLVVLDRVIPGEEILGTRLRDGNRLLYKFNGKYVHLLFFLVLGLRYFYTAGALPELVFLYEHLLEILTASILFSFLLTTILYIAPFFYKSEPLLATGGNTGNPIFDWYIGRELNPRSGLFDWKVFCEMRPGLMLWMAINLAMAHHQYLKFGYITDSMILVNIFQNYYIVEGTFYEDKLINMMDVTTDGFGFMLLFGDLVLVPFSYTLQTRYLADHPYVLGPYKSAAIFALYVLGYVIFRCANNQKNAFKDGHPSTAHLRYLKSPTGSKLITSSWWGISRHINYTGDWLVCLSYSLPTGFNTPLTYYFPIFFAVLLIHRNARDEAKCAEKYGDTWIEYKKEVPYALIPYVY